MELTTGQQIYLDMVIVAFLAIMAALAWASWTAYAAPRAASAPQAKGDTAKAAAKA